MAAEIQLIVNRLSRLNKTELIDIIVNRKLPECLSDCTMLDYIKVKNSEKSDDLIEKDDSFVDASDVNTTINDACAKCVKWSHQLDVKSKELENNCKLISHLEDRIKEQSDNIVFLQSFITNKNNEHRPLVSNKTNKYFSEPRNLQPVAINQNDKSVQPNSRNQREPHLQVPTATVSGPIGSQSNVQSSNLNNVSTNVTSRGTNITSAQVNSAVQSAMNNLKNVNNFKNGIRFQRKPIIGMGRSDSNIMTIPKMGFLHVYRIHPDTTQENLKKYLSKTAPNISFECEAWNKTSNSASFKVSFPIQDVTRVYDPAIWPEGAAVRRFFHKTNFTSQQSTSQQT